MNFKKQSGFSLIELLIVVAIIGIIAAIAVPNLLAARRSANMASAKQTMRSVDSANAVYFSGVGRNNYATPFNQLANSNNGSLDESVISALGTTPKSGYVLANYATTPGNTTQAADYSIQNAPALTTGVTRTGDRQYFIRSDSVIRESTNATSAATSSSSPIQ